MNVEFLRSTDLGDPVALPTVSGLSDVSRGNVSYLHVSDINNSYSINIYQKIALKINLKNFLKNFKKETRADSR